MWTIVNFALQRDADYRAAFDLLAPAGFRPHRKPSEGEQDAFPAAVVAELFQDPAVITRAVFEGLHDAGLRPVGVTACHVEVARPPRAPRPLARA
jgi:hypothetical protein